MLRQRLHFRRRYICSAAHHCRSSRCGVLRHPDMGCLRLADGADLRHLRHLFALPAGEFTHHILKKAGAEQLPEDNLLLIGLRPQKLHEFALGDHSHLHELGLIQPQDLLQLLVGLFDIPGIFPAVRHDEGDGLLFVDDSPAALCGADMAEHPVHRKCSLFPLGEFQLHKRSLPRRGELALQLLAALLIVSRAGLAVEGVDHGVKYGGFSGSRISRDEKQVLVRLPEIDDCLLPVGSEGLQCQLYGSHPSSPSPETVFITSLRSSSSPGRSSPRKSRQSSKGSRSLRAAFSAAR